MKSKHLPGVVSYQWTLRCVGDFVDREGGQDISVVEVPEGLILTYWVEGGSQFRSREFAEVELLAFREQFEQSGLNGTGPQAPRGGYQDYLRALGWELDHLGAYGVVLDEVGSAMLVTYLYIDPTDTHVEKRYARVEPQERQAVLSKAYNRASSSIIADFGTRDFDGKKR